MGRSRVNAMAVSPDGAFLAVASYIGLWVYNLRDRSDTAYLWDPHEHISAVTISATGTWIATGSAEGVVKIWALSTGDCICELDRGSREPANRVDFLAFSPDNTRLAATGGSPQTYSVDIWRAAPRSDRPLFAYEQKIDANPEKIPCDCAHLGSIAFSPDNTLLACTSPGVMADSYAPDRRTLPLTEVVSVWHIPTRSHLLSLEAFTDKVYSIAFSPCGSYIAAGDESGRMVISEVPDAASDTQQQWHSRQLPSADMNARRLVSYTAAGELRAADFSFHDGTLAVRVPEYNRPLYQHRDDTTTYRPDFSAGTYLAFSSYQEIHVVSVESAETRLIIHGHHVTAPESLQFSADGHTVFACQRHYGIFAWALENPHHPLPLFKPEARASDPQEAVIYLAMVAAPNKKIFAVTAHENRVCLWNVGEPTPIAAFPMKAEPAGAAFSPLANRLACRGTDDLIYVWDVQRRALCDTYKAEGPSDIQPLTFSPNGDYLLSPPDGLYDFNRSEKVEGFPVPGRQFHGFSPCSTRIAAETADALLLWDIRQSKTVLSLSKPRNWQRAEVAAIAFSPCGAYLAATPIYGAVEAAELQIWSLCTGETLTVLDIPGPVEAITFSPDGTLLATANFDGTLLLWDMKPYLTRV